MTLSNNGLSCNLQRYCAALSCPILSGQSVADYNSRCHLWLDKKVKSNETRKPSKRLSRGYDADAVSSESVQ